jgi:beta-carotene 3-hydroxylase
VIDMSWLTFSGWFLTALVAMEGVAYLTHRFLMHGPLWFLHRSHHVPHEGGWEWTPAARGCCRSAWA